MTCNHDCFNCVHSDCIREGVTAAESKEILKRDREERLILEPKNPYSRKWAKENPEKNRECSKRYYHANIEKCRQKNRDYYHSHKQYYREREKTYYMDPEKKEKRRQYMREYHRRRKTMELEKAKGLTDAV